jgi:para-nitrobenzyl esterase
MRAGRQHATPLLIGANADEGSVFVIALQAKELSVYEEFVRLMLKENADKMLKLRPVTDLAGIKPALANLATNAFFVTSARLVARSMERVNAKAYYYHFTKHRTIGVGSALGAHHAAEVPYVFGTLDRMKMGDETDKALSEKMIAYWTRFAKTGDPNGQGLPRWPVYTPATDEYLELGATIEAKRNLHKEDCDLLDEIMAERRARR